jgi:hypothetical protein
MVFAENCFRPMLTSFHMSRFSHGFLGFSVYHQRNTFKQKEKMAMSDSGDIAQKAQEIILESISEGVLPSIIIGGS